MISTTTLGWAAAMGVLAVVAAVAPLVTTRRSPAARLSRTVGLMPPEQPLLGVVDRRGRRLIRWQSTGGALGLVATVGGALLAALTGLTPDPATLLPWIGFAGILIGGSLAALLAVVSDRTTADPTTPRVAHTRAVRLRDYIDPLEVNGARVLAALGTIAAVVALAWPAPFATLEPFRFVVALSAAGALAALALAEIGGRRIVLARPRTADSPVALAWDDALRSADLRTLFTAPLLLGLYATIFGTPVLTTPLLEVLPEPWIFVAINVGAYLGVAVIIAVVVIALLRQPGRYYLKRLWPEVAAAAALAGSAR
ncbi:hypothetical protein [Protaetiibacter larvae]|uniref:Uncharacterized protein n=1 Tax=Protaetiibacter larvae TaxID=2592654 RepID=A0A5C1Y7T5_9MICO|nr:hypothetical protein [Protaetiibacter larvae]QEO08977.1 hypothetical protein FLP23_02475 [Protaetiibacter larvae]